MANGDDVEAFELELQALQSIYFGDDVRLTREKDGGRVIEVVVPVRPATCEDVEKQYLSIEVVFSIHPTYPAVPPAISFLNPRGLSEDDIDTLSRRLESIASELLGTEMLLPLVDAVKDCLTLHNEKPHGQCCICLEDFAPDEGITRTICTHCVHSHCLADYIAHAVKEQRKSPVENKKIAAKSAASEPIVLPCPVCREPMQPLNVDSLRKQPPPVVRSPPQIDIHSETLILQQVEFFNQLRLAREARLAEEAKKAAAEAQAEIQAAVARAQSLSPSQYSKGSQEETAQAPHMKNNQEATKSQTAGLENDVQDSVQVVDNTVRGANCDGNNHFHNNQRFNNRRQHGHDRNYYRQYNHNREHNEPNARPLGAFNDDNAQQQAPHRSNNRQVDSFVKESELAGEDGKNAPPLRRPYNGNQGESYYHRHNNPDRGGRFQNEDRMKTSSSSSDLKKLSSGGSGGMKPNSSSSDIRNLASGGPEQVSQHSVPVQFDGHGKPPPGFGLKTMPVASENSDYIRAKTFDSKRSDDQPSRYYNNTGEQYRTQTNRHSVVYSSNRNKQSSSTK